MITKTPELSFTITDLHHTAEAILKSKPDDILAYRLLHEVLGVPSNDTQLIKAKTAALNGKWVHQLKETQLPNGSWGRFHTQDTKLKTVFRTTEEAMDRAIALGLEPGEEPLAAVAGYISSVLRGEARITDWYEKNDAFPVLIKFILAGRLAQIDPGSNLLDLFWIYMTEIAEQAFSSGNYRPEDEANAYLLLSGIHYSRGFLASQHSLWVLSSHPLPRQLDKAIVKWVWQKPGGIGYLGVKLAEPQPRQIGYWLRSMNILARFDSWLELSVDTLNCLWQQRDEQGLWDFGSKTTNCVDFPLSDDWRNKGKRKLDYSTLVLILLRKCFD